MNAWIYFASLPWMLLWDAIRQKRYAASSYERMITYAFALCSLAVQTSIALTIILWLVV